jgi:hypothetical protein
MRNFGRVPLLLGTALASSAVALAMAPAAGASSNTQVILSATGISTSDGPAGFWIWSTPSGNNAYGPDGAGSMYFYALLKAEHPVEVSNVSVSGSTVSETVQSKDGLINCPSFTGTETSPGHGTVSFTCDVTTPTGMVTVTATTPAQVNISSVH